MSFCVHVTRKPTVTGEGPRWLGQPNGRTANQALTSITPDRQQGVLWGDIKMRGPITGVVFVMADVQIPGLNLDLFYHFRTPKFRHWFPKVLFGSIKHGNALLSGYQMPNSNFHACPPGLPLLESMHLDEPHLVLFRPRFPTPVPPQIASTPIQHHEICQQAPVFSTPDFIEGVPILAATSAWWLMQDRLDNSVGMHAIGLVNTPTWC